MSDVKNYGALRFKFTREFKSTNEMYHFIRGILGEPVDIDYVSNWNGSEFVTTDEVEHFEYPFKKGSYVVLKGDSDDVWYLDYLLLDMCDNYQDLEVSLDLEELNNIRLKTLDKFPNSISDECKIKIVEWYTCSEMPVNF